jgi:hypothetical protein
MTARVVVPGSSVGRRPTTADTKEKRLIATVDVVVPASTKVDDADELRIQVEKFVEKLVKTLFTEIDESRFCEAVWTEVYRTTTAWAERGDYCLGRLSSDAHVHASEAYGRNLNEFWANVQIFVEPVEEDEDE